MAFIHVDDMVVGVNEKSPFALQKFQAISEHWDWGEWEYDHFVQTGLDILQTPDYNIFISFEKAAKKVEMIEMTKEIRDLPEDTALGRAGKTANRWAN